MKHIDEIFIEKAKRIRSLSLFGRIALESFKIAHNSPESELRRLFTEMSENLPGHYLAGRDIGVAEYKVVSFVDSQSLISIISEVEAFFQEALIEVICRYPGTIQNKAVEIRQLRDFDSIETAVRFAAQKHVSSIMREAPNVYKKHLVKVLALDESLLDDVWPTYVEAKARRDIGVHNSWKVDDNYQSKVKSVGLPDVHTDELSVDVKYFLQVAKVAVSLMDKVRGQCADNFA